MPLTPILGPQFKVYRRENFSELMSSSNWFQMSKKRRTFSASFKAKVALEALQERHTLSELSQKYGLHPNQITTWKIELKGGAESVFQRKRGPASGLNKGKEAQMYQQIGQLQFELSWLKKKYESS